MSETGDIYFTTSSEVEGEYYHPVLRFDVEGNRASFRDPHTESERAYMALAADGTVYEATDRLCAYTADGVELWSSTEVMPDSVLAPLVTDDGSVILTYDGQIGRFDSSGHLQWKIGTGYFGRPAMDDRGVIYAWFGQGETWKWHRSYLQAISPDGMKLWEYEIPMIPPGTSDSNLLPSLALPESEYSTVFPSLPVVGMSNVLYVGYTNLPRGGSYFKSADGWVFAVDLEGIELWRHHTDRGGPTDFGVCPDDSVCFGLWGVPLSSKTTKYFICLDSNGAEKWRFSWKGHFSCESPPVIGSDGVVYLIGNDNLYAINSDGDLLWQYEVGGPLHMGSMSIGPDGTLHVACSGSVWEERENGDGAYIGPFFWAFGD